MSSGPPTGFVTLRGELPPVEPRHSPPSRNARNDQARLPGTFLNNTGIACLVTGLIAPAAGYSYGFSQQPGGRLWWLIALAWLVSGIALHVLARRGVRSIP